MFDLVIASPKKIIFQDAVESLWVDGDQSEFELLSWHAHVIGLVRDKVIINRKIQMKIKNGVLRFYENKCHILVQAEGDLSTNPADYST